MENHIVVVIPTYNERENIVELIRRLEEEFRKHGVSHEYLVVDDNSPDGTAEAVKSLAREIPDVNVIVRMEKKGIGSAIMDGFRHALRNKHVTHILTMDADLSHRPEDLAGFIKEMYNADLVQGSRYVKGGGTVNWGIHRRIISWTANWLVRTLYHTGLHEHTTNYRLYNRRAAEAVLKYAKSTGYEWVIEALLIIHAHGYRIVEVPIIFINRRKGRSKLGISEIIKWFIYIVKFQRTYKMIKKQARND